ncbi:MAG: hypothetical protein WD069_15745 [Planctomycetales bacterium]
MRAVAIWLGATASLVAQDADSAGRTPAPPKEGVHQIYVPFSAFDAVLEREPKGVLLPGDEFRKLYREARLRGGADDRVPRGVAISGATYRVRVDGERFVISAEVDFRTFRDGWHAAALPFRGLAIDKATIDGEAARLGRLAEAGGGLYLIDDRAGAKTLALEMSAPLAAVGSDRVAEFGLLPRTPATLEVELPAGKHLVLNESPVERPAAAEEAATYRLPVGGSGNLALRVTDRTAAEAGDRLLFATTGYGLNVAPGEVLWHAAATIQLYGRAVDRLVFRVPNALEIADVNSTGLEAWELADDEDVPNTTRITATFRQPVEGTRQIVFTGVMNAAVGEPWEAPRLAIVGATSHMGRIAVRQPPGVRLEIEEASGVRRIEAERPSDPASSGPPTQVTLAFDVWREDFTLRFVTRTKDRELVAVMSTVLAVDDQAIDLSATATLTPFFAPLFDPELTLPAEWTVTAALVDGAPAEWKLLAREAGLHHVVVRLPRPVAPGESAIVELQARRELENRLQAEGEVELELPEVRLPAAGIVAGTYVIHYPGHLDVVPLEVEGLDPTFLQDDSEVRSAERGARSSEQDPQSEFRTPHSALRYLAYSYQDSRFAGTMKVVVEPARVAATTSTTARLDPEALRAHVEALLDIEGGGIRGLAVSLPEQAGTDLRFSLWPASVRITEQQPGAVRDGRREWSLAFDRRLEGRFLLAVDVQSPREKAERFRVPDLRIAAAERQHGTVAIEAGPQQRLTIAAHDAEARPLDPLDPIDFAPPRLYVPQERIVAAFRYVRPGFEVTLAEERFDRVAVPTAVCTVQRLTSLVSRDGGMQHRAEMALKAVGVQALRIDFPENGSPQPLWAVELDGEPVEVRRSGGTYRIPFAAGDAQATHSLVLHYASATGPFDMFDRFAERPPALSVERGDGTVQPIDVLERTWDLRYPRKLLLLDSEGGFHPQGDLDAYSLLGALRRGFRDVSLADLLGEALWLAGAAALVLLVGLTHRRWGRRGLLALGLMGVIGLMLGVIVVVVSAWSMSPFIYTLDGTKSMNDMEIDFGGGTRETTTTPASGEESYGSVTIEQPGLSFRGGFDPDEPMVEPAPQPATPPAPVQEVPALPQRVNGDIIAGQTVAGEAAPQDAPPRSSDQTIGPAYGGARLSVKVETELPDPEAFHQKSFAYAGANSQGVELRLASADRDQIEAFRWFVAVLLFALSWLLRNFPLALRGTLAAVGLALPLALLTIVPAGWQIALDGVFLGTLAGVGAWLVRGAVRGWSRRPRRVRVRPVATTVATLFAAALLLPALAAAQSPPQPDPRRAVPNDDFRANDPFQSDDGFRNAVPRREPAESVLTRPEAEAEITVIVPFDAAEDPLAATRVFLPYEKFVELWNRAHPERAMRAPPPIPGVVAATAYSAEVAAGANAEEPRVAVRGRIVLYSFRDEPVTLGVPFGKVALRSARLNGESAPLVAGENAEVGVLGTQYGVQRSEVRSQKSEVGEEKRGGDSELSVVLSKAGLHVLDVEFDLPVRTVGPAGRFTVPLRPVPAGSLSFALPAAELEVRVDGSTSAYRRRTEAGRTWIEVPVDAAGDVTVAWQPSAQRGGVERTVHAEGTHRLDITDAGAALSSGYVFHVRQGPLSQAGFSLPEGVMVRRISGPDLAGWQIEGEAGERTLRVDFRRPIDTSTQLSFDLFLAARFGEEAATLELPAFAPRDVTRETGTVAVYAEEQFAAEPRVAEGLRRIDLAGGEIPVHTPGAPGALRFAWRYAARPVRLALEISRRGEETRTTAVHAVAILQRHVIVDSRLTYDLQGAPRSRLVVRLPPLYFPLEVEATALADWYVHEDQRAGTRELVVEMASPRRGLAEIVLRGQVPKDPDDGFVELTVPEPAQADRVEKFLAVRLHEAYSATVEEMAGWRAIPPDELPAELQQREGAVRLAFRSTSTAETVVSIGIERAEPLLSADSITTVTVADQQVDCILHVRWTIDRAATDTFRFVTPAALSGRLELKAAGVRQVSETPLADGLVRWTITLQRPVTRSYSVTGTATLPPPADDRIEAPVPVVERPAGVAEDGARLAPLPAQRRYVVLFNASRGRLVPLDPQAFETVRPAELPVKAAQPEIAERLEQAAARLRLAAGDKPPVWKIERFAAYEGAAAVIRVADLLTVHAHDGTYRGRGVYTMRNRGRQYLPLAVPPAVHILSVMVKDPRAGDAPRPARLVRGKDDGVHLVPIPQTSRADLPFEVHVVFASTEPAPLPRGLAVRAPVVQPEVPRVVEPRGADDALGIAVERTAWRVYLPPEFDAEPVKDRARQNLSAADEATAQAVRTIGIRKEQIELGKVIANAAESIFIRRQALGNYYQLEKQARQSEATLGVSDSELRDGVPSTLLLGEELGKLKAQAEQVKEQAEVLSLDESAALASPDSRRWQNAANEELAQQLFDDEPRDSGRDDEQSKAGKRFDLRIEGKVGGESASVESKSGDKKPQTSPDFSRSKLLEQSQQQGAQKLAESGRQRRGEELDEADQFWESTVPNAPGLPRAPGLRPQHHLIDPFAQEPGPPASLRSHTVRNQTPFRSPLEPQHAGGVQFGAADGGLAYAPHQGFVAGADVAGFDPAGAIAGEGRGALSIEVDVPIPADATVLAFTKVGGDPRLALSVRPRESLETGVGLLWSLVWLAVGIGAAVAFHRAQPRRELTHRVAWACVAVGIVGFFLLAAPLSWGALALAVAAGLVVALRRPQS